MNPETNYFEPALSLDQLAESTINPRRAFNPEQLAELAGSIAEKGIIEPLVVRPVNGHGFEIVAGARRFRAAKLAGLETVPAIVRHYEDAELLELMLVENIQRADLSPLEQAAGYRALMQANPDKHHVASIAQRVGMSSAWVWDRLKLNDLIEPVKAWLAAERISVGHAIPIARLQPDVQARVVDPAIGGLWAPDNGFRFATAPERQECSACHGAQYVCQTCGQADGECTCEESPELVRCTSCPADDVAVDVDMKPRSIRELETWIREHVRFDPSHAAQAQPLQFEDVAHQVETAKAQPGRGKKVIGITCDYMPAADAKDPEERTYGGQAWQRADGQDGSTVCDYAVLGLVVAGARDYGKAFEVCIAKDKCRTHWGQLMAVKEKAAKQRAAGDTVKADRTERKGESSWEAEDRKRREQRERWDLLKPHVLRAVASRVKSAKITPKLLTRVFEALAALHEKTVTQLLGTGVITAENFARAVALIEVVDESWDRERCATMAKQYGVDVQKLEASLAPKAASTAAPASPIRGKATKPSKAKKTAKPAKKGSRR